MRTSTRILTSLGLFLLTVGSASAQSYFFGQNYRIPANGIAFVAAVGASATGGAPTTVTTASMNNTGANFLSCAVSSYNSTASTVTDSTNANSWSSLNSYTDSAGTYVQLWYAANATVSSSQTITASNSGANIYPSVACASFSGVATSSAFDQQNGNNASSITVQPGSITPSGNGYLVLTGLSASSGSSFSINGSYTVAAQEPYNSGAAMGAAMAYWIQSTATATNPTWTSNATAGLAADIASFK
jgi:hypothetical protein